MSDTKDIVELLTAFVDGELQAADEQKVRQQVQANAAYWQLLNAERATKNLLGSRLTRYDAPSELKQRIRSALFGREAVSTPETLPERRTVWRPFSSSPATASALGAVVLVAILGIVFTTYGADRVTPYVEDVRAHHTNVSGFPVQFTGSREAVADDTSKAVGFAVVVPDLGRDVDLEGSRKCALCGHAIAFMKYGGTEGRISFFIIPGQSPAIWRLDRREHDEFRFYTTDHQGVRMAFWRDGNATYCLAAAVPEDRLMDLACTACRQVQLSRAYALAAVAPPMRLAAHNDHSDF